MTPDMEPETWKSLGDRAKVISLLWQYSYLQVLDFLTTVAFLMIGMQEGNPIVRIVIRYAPTPVIGLIMVKIAAMALGVYCLKMGKQQLLKRMNILFAVVVAWNLVALILGAVQMPRP